MLPNINGQQPAQTAPGTNPNQRTKQTSNSVLSQYSSTLLSQLADNISPTNFVRQGTYNAFGNNVLTRSAMGAMDTTSGLIDKFLGIGGEDENETTTDKLLKEQIKLLNTTNKEINDTNDILKEILEVEKTKVETQKEEKSEHDVEKIHKKKKKPEIHPRNFASAMIPNGDLHQLDNKEENILTTIARDVVDIKEILTNGFDSMANIFTHEDGQHKFNGKKNRKLDGVEDAVILSETRFGDNKKKAQTLLQKYQLESLKLLKRIASGVDKIYELVSQSTNMTAPEDKTEAGRREKHMGMAEEVSDVLPKPQLQLPDETGGGMTGAAAAIITTLIASLKGVREKIVEMFKAGIEKFKGVLESAWQFGKDTVSKAFSWVKEKGGSLLESAEKAAGELSEKIAGKGGIKAIAKKGLGSILKATPLIGELAMGGLAAYDAYDASKNAKDILGIEGRDATTGERIEAGIGGAVESLSFGLISKEKTAKWIDGLMTTKNEKQDELTKKQDELNQMTRDKVNPPAEAAGAPSVAVNTTNNSYFSGKKNARNEDVSYNRYLDRHYAF